ncbi:hypothetical protein CsSME_00003485 [Camellia sinensis var. sinensis]
MASAVLASRNEPYWGERKVYMRKYTNSSNKPRFNNFNPDPINTSPNRLPNRQIHDSSSTKTHAWHNDQPPLRPAPPDDSSELNWKPNDPNAHGESSHGGYLTFNLAAYSKAELKELKRRLRSELEQVRGLRARIDNHRGRDDYRSGYHGGGRDAASVVPRPPPLQLDSAIGSPAAAASGSKEKRTPKANQFQPPADFATGKNKKVSGLKRAFPFVSGRDPKRHVATDSQMDKLVTSMMRRCGLILGKLMKHKHGWVFNTPVDVVGLGLHDYHQIIKQPMDLGTVKSRLSKKEYVWPLDFASDVRLTFNNAKTYNPKGQDVYVMAETLLGLFDQMFNPAYKKFEAEHQRVVAAEQVNQRIWAPAQEPVIMEENVRRSLPQPAAMLKKSDSMRVQETLPSPLAVEEVEAVVAPVSIPPAAAAAAAAKPVVMPRSTQKLPKPKARDPNKRQMSFEEKARLGLNLQNLPLEKMDQMLEIIKKRNSHMAQEGDEIELDIEALDNETLWELDRFVSNHKKAESKMKRQGLMNNVVLTAPIAAPINKSPVREPTPEAVGGQKSRKGDAGEEDVDIGEEIPINNFPPVEIEKDVANGSSRSSSSSSSSSSSDSSSSSGSDSASSSGSDSDEDSVQSPFVESKEAS